MISIIRLMSSTNMFAGRTETAIAVFYILSTIFRAGMASTSRVRGFRWLCFFIVAPPTLYGATLTNNRT